LKSRPDLAVICGIASVVMPAPFRGTALASTHKLA